MSAHLGFRLEWRGAVEATLQGLINVVSPVLLFVLLLGPDSLEAGMWATLVTASVVPAVALLLRGHRAILSSARIASLAVYIGLVLQLCQAMGFTLAAGGSYTLWQLSMGLAAASAMFALACLLVMLAGLLKFGTAFKMIPTPVTAGISNGIAVILVMLSLQQLTRSAWVSSITACAMVACYFGWPVLQRLAAWLGGVPAIVFTAGVGVVLTWLLEPALLANNAGVATSWGWVSFRLWPLLGGQNMAQLLAVGLPGAATLAFVMILETFTTAAAMETRFGVRVDPNRELIVLGSSNLVGAVLGGVPSTGSIIRSLAGWLQGGRGLPAALIGLALTSGLLLWLGSWLMVLPAGIVAGFFLVQAVLTVNQASLQRLASMVRSRKWRSTGTQDLGFWITLVITLTTVFGNLIWACCLGVGLSCLAVLRRVSSNLMAQWADLGGYRSRRVRSYGETMSLARLHRRVAVLRLTGHLFFGNSMRLTQLADDLHPDAVAVAIDISQVHDVDASGVDALKWLVRTLIERKLTVVLTGLKHTRSDLLRLPLQVMDGVVFCTDLDRGLEACEDLVLLNATVVAVALQSNPLSANALLQGLDDDEITAVLLLGEFRDVAKGAALFYRDSPADGVWLLESGVVSILTGNGDTATRLATFGPGQFLGEMSFIDGKTRSATAWADSPVRALLLDNEALASLALHQSAAALKLTRNIARELSHRVRYASALWADESGEVSSVWGNSALNSSSQF